MPTGQLLYPKISVLLVNRDPTLNLVTLRSLLHQSHREWDAVVLDFSENGARIARTVMDNADHRVRYYGVNQGGRLPFSSVVSGQTGTVFAFLLNGDRYGGTYLAELAQIYAANPQLQATVVWAETPSGTASHQVPLYLGAEWRRSPLLLSQISVRRSCFAEPDLERESEWIAAHLSGLNVICLPRTAVSCQTPPETTPIRADGSAPVLT